MINMNKLVTVSNLHQCDIIAEKLGCSANETFYVTKIDEDKITGHYIGSTDIIEYKAKEFFIIDQIIGEYDIR